MKERLRQLMNDKGLNSSELAELLHVQPSAISHILSGRNNPRYDFIVTLLTVFPDIDSRWLLTGVTARNNEPAKEILPPKGDDNILCFEDQAVQSVSKTPESSMEESPETETLFVCYNDGTFKNYKLKK